MTAVPADINVRNLTGVYDLNGKISDSSDKLLQMQEVSWVIRQAVYWSSLQVTLTPSKDDQGRVLVEQKQVSSLQTNVEHWIIDGEQRDKESAVWGPVAGYHKYIKLSEVTDEYLNQGWDDADGEIIEAKQHSETKGWAVHQLIGFAEVDGIRRHVRRIVGRKGEEVHQLRMVYDYKPPAEEEESSGMPEGMDPDA